jgi:hypothetical protein
MAGSATDHRPEKDTGEKKIGRFTRPGGSTATAVFLALVLLVAPVQKPVNLPQLQQRFDQEKDGVRKAKMLQKLGDAEFARERELSKAGDYSAVGLEMEKYRDNVRAAVEALKKTHPDAEKHSGGYRQLEMHVGSGIREIRDVILAVPEPYRPPMMIVEKDLKELDAELLRLLFPRRPGEQPPISNGNEPGAPAEKQP